MLKVHFLNVQHGDCAILEFVSPQGSKFGLVDSNKVGARVRALEKLIELGAQELSFLCITHPDADHYTGMLEVLEYYEGRIGKIFTFPLHAALTRVETLKKWSTTLSAFARGHDAPKTKPKVLELLKVLLKFESQYSQIWHDGIIGPGGRVFQPDFPGVEIEMVLPPSRAKGPFVTALEDGAYQLDGAVESNGISLATLVTYQGKHILLGGDATNDNWLWLLKERGGSFAADIVKMPHHGSKHDCTPASMATFFKQEGAKIAIISANGKAQPDPGVLGWLIKNRIRPLCTNFSTKWGSPRKVVPLLDTRDIAPETAAGLVQSQVQDGKYTPCKGDITLSIGPNGEITHSTERAMACPCDYAQLDEEAA